MRLRICSAKNTLAYPLIQSNEINGQQMHASHIFALLAKWNMLKRFVINISWSEPANILYVIYYSANAKRCRWKLNLFEWRYCVVIYRFIFSSHFTLFSVAVVFVSSLWKIINIYRCLEVGVSSMWWKGQDCRITLIEPNMLCLTTK